MTSNIGARQVKDFGSGVGFQTSQRQSNEESAAKAIIEKAMKKSFAPEFLNRVDDIIIFDELSKEDIAEIVKIELRKLEDRVNALGYKFRINQKSIEFLCKMGYDPDRGARPLQRAIQRYLEDPIANEIVNTIDNKKSGTINVTYTKDAEELNVKLNFRKTKEVREEDEPKNED